MTNHRYIFATTIIIFGSSFQFGYQTGVINSPQSLIIDFIGNTTRNRGYNATESFKMAMLTLVTSGFAIGGVFGALAGGPVSNKMGRKLALFIFNVPMAVGSLLMMASEAAKTFEMTIIGRILVGFSCGGFTSITPAFLTEIAPLKSRGVAGIMHQQAIVCALLISQILGLSEIMGTKQLWPYLLGLTIVPSVILLLFLWLCPDSPRYILLNSQDREGARNALRWYRGKDSEMIDSELEEILVEQESQVADASKFQLKNLFVIKSLRLALFISVVAHLAQQFSGINVALQYSTSLFEGLVSTSIAKYATLGVGSMLVLMTVVSIFIIDRVGRRLLLISGLTVMFGSAIIITIATVTRHTNNNLAYAAIVFVYIFVGGFAIGPGSIPWFLVAELFVQETRDPAIVIAVFVNWTAQIVVVLGFPHLSAVLGDYSMLPFVVLLAIFIALLFIYLPETKGRTPQEVQEVFVRMAAGGPRMRKVDPFHDSLGDGASDGEVDFRAPRDPSFRSIDEPEDQNKAEF